MRKIAVLILLAMAALGLLSGSSSQANSLCVKTGLRIFGEPWVAHHFCLPCPDADCPGIPTGDDLDLRLDPAHLPVAPPGI
jgi:hypothetical protein